MNSEQTPHLSQSATDNDEDSESTPVMSETYQTNTNVTETQSSFGMSTVTNTRKEMFYLTTHSTHFIYGYMASDIW